jgi:hypothetical protein
LAIAGLEKLFISESIVRSHDGQATGAALVNGDKAIYRRVHLDLFGERGVHLFV